MECLNIPSLRYSSFSRKLHYKPESARIPLEGAIELTSRCNLSCRHCYIKDNSLPNELTYPECCRIIDEIAEAGCLWLTFTGGEPFLRRDFLDIYTYAKRKGLLIVIFTNGTLITPEIADYLQELKPFYLEISLYGMSRQTYAAVTGSADAYERCREAISLFMEREIAFKLKSMLIETNKHDIIAMKQFAQRLKVDFRFDFLINPRIDGARQPCELRINPEEGVNMEMVDPEIRREMAEAFLELSAQEKSDLLFPCAAGLNSFNIDSRGNLHLCNMVRFISFNLRQMSFQQGWDMFPEVLSRKTGINKRCLECGWDSICNRCPGWAMMEHQDPGAWIEYACAVTYFRVKTIFGKEVREYGDKSKETISETAA